MPPSRRRLAFAVVAIALFMAAMDQTIVATALTAINRDLGSGIQWSGWAITIYALTQVVVMPLAGKLSDIYGRKRIFVAAAATFSVSSLLCGLAHSMWLLIALRALQAVGGGAFNPTGSGIVSDLFGDARDRALGLFTTVFTSGAIVGPILGGVIVTYGTWREIFFINVPIGAALLTLAILVFPRDNGRRQSAPLDVPGVLLAGVALLGTMFAITILGDGTRPTQPLFYGPAAAAIVALLGYVWHARRAASPFIPIPMLIGRGFGTMNIINVVLGGAIVGFAALVPLYAQERFDVSTLESGIPITARAVAMVSFSALVVVLLRKVGYRAPILVGLLLSAAGFFAMTRIQLGHSPIVWLSVTGVIMGLGGGVALPAANNATLHLASEHVASISGLRGMFRQVGAILVVSVIASATARAHDPGLALATSFIVVAAIMVAAVPLLLTVPDHRGSW